MKQYTTYATHVAEISKQFNPFGIIGLAYMRIYNDGSIVNLASCPNWTEFYYNQLFCGKYHSKDIADHLLIAEGLSLWALNPENQVWQDVKNKFGYANGVTICKQYENFREITGFYATTDNHSINHFYINHTDTLKKIKYAFISQAKQLIEKAELDKALYSHPILIEKKVVRNEISDTNITHTYENQKISVLHRITGLPVHISSQRSQCLLYLLEGKSTKAIANKMGLSNKTVEHYLEILRKELGCKNKTEIILSYFHQIDNYLHNIRNV